MLQLYSIYFMRFICMLHMFYLNVVKVDWCCICCNDYTRMLQNTCFKCFSSWSGIIFFKKEEAAGCRCSISLSTRILLDLWGPKKRNNHQQSAIMLCHGLASSHAHVQMQCSSFPKRTQKGDDNRIANIEK
jgi:hypothetical protein